MALAEKTSPRSARPFPTHHVHSDESAANSAFTVTPTVGRVRRILFVTVKYSANVTVNVTVTLNSGRGSTYDTLLQTIALAAARDGFWIPDEDVILADDDELDVLAPAGGAGVTSTIMVYSEAV